MDNRGYSREKLNKKLHEIYPNMPEKEKLTDDQFEIISAILSGKDSLNILPTGSGKSACYLVAAMLLPGVTLVISPLISLIEDQVKKIRGHIPTACLTSDFYADKKGIRKFYKSGKEKKEKGSQEQENNYSTRRNVRDNNIFLETIIGQKQENGASMEKGYKIIYLTPERLRTGQFIRFARRANISLVAVDEAHCISLWGYDFRKSYLEIPKFLKRLEKRPVTAAFTATATPNVKRDIVRFLKLEDPFFYPPKESKTLRKREELHFFVKNVGKYDRIYDLALMTSLLKHKNIDMSKKIGLFNWDEDPLYLHIRKYLLDHKDDCGIVYCPTVAMVNYLYYGLSREKDLRITRYFAALDETWVKKGKGESKTANWNSFYWNEKKDSTKNEKKESKYKKVMISTNALGMGVDKDNIKYILHAGMPLCLENYYQEAGRAGRKMEMIHGDHCDCIIFYSQNDFEACKAIINYGIKDSQLEKNQEEVRKAIAIDRLTMMKKYCKYAIKKEAMSKKGKACAGHDLQDYIINFFEHYEVNPEGISIEQLEEIDREFSEAASAVDSLYVNRSKLAQMVRKGILEGRNISVSRRNSDYTVSYKIDIPGEGNINYLDMMISDAVYTLIKHGEKKIYAHQVMRLLSGVPGKLIQKCRTKEINERIEKLIKTNIWINTRSAKKSGFYYPDEKLILEGPFLPLTKASKGFVLNTDDTDYGGYTKLLLPPLYEYAEIMNCQYHTFPLSLLKVMLYSTKDGKDFKPVKTLPASFQNIALTHYLLCRIDSMPKERAGTRKEKVEGEEKEQIMRSTTTPNIKMESLMEDLEEFLQIKTYKDSFSADRKKQRTEKRIYEILTHIKVHGYIYDYHPAIEKTGDVIQNSIHIRRRSRMDIEKLLVEKTVVAKMLRQGLNSGQNLHIKNCTVSYKLSEKDGLSYFDMTVYDAVITKILNQEQDIYPREILALLCGDDELIPKLHRIKEKRRHAQKKGKTYVETLEEKEMLSLAKAIDESIRKMTRINMRIEVAFAMELVIKKMYLILEGNDIEIDNDDSDSDEMRLVIQNSFLPLREKGGCFVYDEDQPIPLIKLQSLLKGGKNSNYYSIPTSLFRVMVYKESHSKNKVIKPIKMMPLLPENIAAAHYLLCRFGSARRPYSKADNLRIMKKDRAFIERLLKTQEDFSSLPEDRKKQKIENLIKQILTHIKYEDKRKIGMATEIDI